jgi:acetyltransferase-like isoleucine patch superfamily enzyme
MMMRTYWVLRLVAGGLLSCNRIRRAIKMLLLGSMFKKCGKNVRFDPDGHYTFESIEIGDDVYIGPGPVMYAERRSGIRIGSKVLLGPKVMIIGGNHNWSVIGRFMFDVKEKRPEDDETVIIEDDVWIGAGAIILKGVRIARGSIVGAGAVVTRDVPPYSIVAGVPARVCSHRFTEDAILDHEKCLYPPSERLR